MENTSPKNIVLIVFAILVSVCGLFAAWKLTSKPSIPQAVQIQVGQSDHTQGKKDAKAVLVEYSDFQCPACKAYHPIIKQALEKNKDSVLFVYRHFPLPQHPKAQPAAQAAEAAARQGKFFEYHDKLFNMQDEWSKSDKPEELFLKYAQELKLDLAAFKKDAASKEAKDKINNDRQSGSSYGVNSTPSVFLNGRRLDLPRSVDELDSVIEKELSS